MLEVVNRGHIDLRAPDALSVFKYEAPSALARVRAGRRVAERPWPRVACSDERIAYCFFLACEVGGAKFIWR